MRVMNSKGVMLYTVHTVSYDERTKGYVCALDERPGIHQRRMMHSERSECNIHILNVCPTLEKPTVAFNSTSA